MSEKMHTHKWKIRELVKPTKKYLGVEIYSCKCGAFRQVCKDFDNVARISIGTITLADWDTL